MQTRFQIREINTSKGYCLLVTDKNHTEVTFAFENLDAQLQRLEQFLVYSDDSKRELATVNLIVQRNIPVTFAKPASEIINETIDPDGAEPRIMRAVPVDPNVKVTMPKESAKPSPSPARVRKAVRVQRGRKG